MRIPGKAIRRMIEHSDWGRSVTMRIRVLLVAFVLAATVWFAGCDHYVCTSGATFGNSTCASSSNNNGGGLTGSVFAYFMNDKAGQMAAEAVNLNNSQSFAPIANWVPPPSLCNTDACVDGGLVIVDKAYVYMPYSDGNVYAYDINSTTGALSVLTPVNLGLPSYSVSPIAADPAGKYVFVGDAAGIYVMSVGSTGTLTVTNGGDPFAATGLQPTYLATDGLGKYLYVTDGTNIAAFSYSASTGALTSVGTTPAVGVTMLTGEPSGGYMFGTTQSNGAHSTTLDDNIYIFPITSSTGALGSATVVSTPDTPSFIAVSPNVESGSELVYTFNEDDNSTGLTPLEPVVGFPFNPSTGALGTPTPSTFLSSVGHFDQSGNFLIVVGQASQTATAGVLALEVTSTGSLENNLPTPGDTSLSFAVTDEP